MDLTYHEVLTNPSKRRVLVCSPGQGEDEGQRQDDQRDHLHVPHSRKLGFRLATPLAESARTMQFFKKLGICKEKKH